MTSSPSAGTLDESDAPLAPQSVDADRERSDDGGAVGLLSIDADRSTADERERVRFLAEPSWAGGMSGVASVLSPYVRAFWPDEPVSLLLLLPAVDPRSLAEAVAITREAIEACGRSADEAPEIVLTRARPRGSQLDRVDAVMATDGALVQAARECGAPVVAPSRGALRAAFGDAVARREFERLVPMLRSVCTQAAVEHPLRPAVSPLLETIVNGYRHFLATGESPEEAVTALRALDPLTDGRLSEALTGLHARAHPPYEITVGSGLLAEEEIARVVAEVVDTGVSVVPGRFPAAARAQLAAWATRTTDVSEPTLLAMRVVRAFAMDLSVLAVTQGALGCAPVLTAIEIRGGSQRAGAGMPPADQPTYAPATETMNAVHVSVFLTAPTGELRLVRESHRGRPLALRRPGHFTEEEVVAAFGHEKVTHVVGPPGTVVITDARCLRSDAAHGAAARAATLTTRFASSLFGAPARWVRVEHDAPGGFAQMVERCPRTYARYLGRGLRPASDRSLP